MKKPSKVTTDALKLFALFLNAFREKANKQPVESLNNWSNLLNFVLRSPSTNDLCLELQKLKKVITRPHLSNISEQTY